MPSIRCQEPSPRRLRTPSPPHYRATENRRCHRCSADSSAGFYELVVLKGDDEAHKQWLPGWLQVRDLEDLARHDAANIT